MHIERIFYRTRLKVIRKLSVDKGGLRSHRILGIIDTINDTESTTHQLTSKKRWKTKQRENKQIREKKKLILNDMMSNASTGTVKRDVVRIRINFVLVL